MAETSLLSRFDLTSIEQVLEIDWSEQAVEEIRVSEYFEHKYYNIAIHILGLIIYCSFLLWTIAYICMFLIFKKRY